MIRVGPSLPAFRRPPDPFALATDGTLRDDEPATKKGKKPPKRRLTPEQYREISDRLLAKWNEEGIAPFLRRPNGPKKQKRRGSLTPDEIEAIRRWTGAAPRDGTPQPRSAIPDGGGRPVRTVSGGLPESSRRKH